MNNIFINKYVSVDTFTNSINKKMFSIRFVVGEESEDFYRGWPLKKAKKIAKMLRKMAKKIERL